MIDDGARERSLPGTDLVVPRASAFRAELPHF